MQFQHRDTDAAVIGASFMENDGLSKLWIEFGRGIVLK